MIRNVWQKWFGDAPAREPGTILTFYSYKGGTGRSMALANVAWILASAGNRVLTVDWDLEAPGLHRYFAPFLSDKKLVATEGIINFADEYRQKAMTPPGKEETISSDWYLPYADLSHYAVRLEWDFKNGYLDFVPAGQQDENYSALVNSFNWKTFFVDLGGNRLLDTVKDKLRQDYDYVLIDSRTGVSDTSGICTVKMPDILVVCFTLNNQSIEGAASVAHDVFNQRGEQVRIYPVPMRLDPGELKKLEAGRERAQERFLPFPNYTGKASRKQYWSETSFNYVPYYAYEEILASFGQGNPDIASMLASAERLTSYLTDGRVAKLDPPPPDLRKKKLDEYEGRNVVATPANKLSEAAQASFLRLSSEEQQYTRRMLLRLVRVPRPDEKGEPVSQRVRSNDFGTGQAALLRKLLDGGLIQSAGEDESGIAMVTLINDELLLDWRELRKWITDDQTFLWWRQKLQSAMSDWERTGLKDDLLTGQALYTARQWMRERPADLSASEVHFIRSSISADRRQNLKLAAAIFLALAIAAAVGYWLISKSRASKQDSADAQKLVTDAAELLNARGTGSGLKDGLDLQRAALLALEYQSLTGTETSLLAKILAQLPRRLTSLKFDTRPVKIAVNLKDRHLTTVSGLASNVDSDGTPSSIKEDRVIDVRELASGRRIAGPIPFKPDVQKFSLSNDGRYVAFSRVQAPQSGNSRPTFLIELLDVFAGTQETVDVRRAPIYDLVFSPDNRLLITTGNEDTAVLIDVVSRKVIKKIRHAGVVNAASFSADSTLVATVSDDFNARVWRVSDPEGAATAMKPINIRGVASKVLFTPDGNHLVTLLRLSGSTFAQLWNLQNQEETRLYHASVVQDVAVSTDGKYVATYGEEGQVRLWDATVSGPEPKLLKMLRSESRYIAFSSDSSYLMATGSNLVNVWKQPEFDHRTLIPGANSFDDVIFLGGGLVVTASESVVVWKVDGEVSSEPCDHVTRNLTEEEWKQILPNRPYRQICPSVVSLSP